MELALRTCEGNEFHTVADTEEKAQEPALDTTRRLTSRFSDAERSVRTGVYRSMRLDIYNGDVFMRDL